MADNRGVAYMKPGVVEVQSIDFPKLYDPALKKKIAHGVILNRPEGEDLHFPIVAGLPESMPREEREKRMQTYQEFLRDADLVRSESSDRVSEVDLSNAKDLRVVMTGLASATDSQAVTIHFGNSDFTASSSSSSSF